jgi:NADH:ubiquinone oxidoreductase subunit 2 (subunit N)
VILSLVRVGHFALAVLAAGCSVVSAFFYMRVAVLMYMNAHEEPAPSRFPSALLAALAVAGMVTLIGGISPGSVAPWTVAPVP